MNKNSIRKKLTHEFNYKFKSKVGRKLGRRLGRKKHSCNSSLKQFGLVGYPLAHTMSPYIHKHIMRECGIDGEFKVYELSPASFESEVIKLMDKLDGFSVTIPYKERIIPLLDGIGPESERFGAVNCVVGHEGHNTDIYGLRSYHIPLKNKRVLLLGAGGVARVLLSEAIQQGAAEIGINSRRPEQAQTLIEEFTDISETVKIYYEPLIEKEIYNVILNATPVGMWPNCDGMPVSREIISGAEFVFDTIYNPLATKLLLTARSMNITAQGGLGMLMHQAVRAQEIWNFEKKCSDFPISIYAQSLKRKLLKHFTIKIVLTGFMGSGKSTVGRALAKALGIGFVDIDLTVVEENAKPISAIFKNDGEPYFRRSEHNCLVKAMKLNKSLVISTGGGLVMNPENITAIKENNGFIFFLKVDSETVFNRIGDDGDRPLLSGKSRQSIAQLYESRMPIYIESADCTVNADARPSEIVRKIKEVLDF